VRLLQNGLLQEACNDLERNWFDMLFSLLIRRQSRVGFSALSALVCDEGFRNSELHTVAHRALRIIGCQELSFLQISRIKINIAV